MPNRLRTKLSGDQLLAGDRLFFISYGLFLTISILSTSFYYQIFVGRPHMWMQIACVLLLVAYEIRTIGIRNQN